MLDRSHEQVNDVFIAQSVPLAGMYALARHCPETLILCQRRAQESRSNVSQGQIASVPLAGMRTTGIQYTSSVCA